MSRHTAFLTATGFGLVALALAPAAAAHIRLLEPTARYDIVGETGIKSCPCGGGTSNRTCNVAVDGSDPNRSTRVTRAEAGSTLTLRFEEYVGHNGTFRVAFDAEGADVADFNQNILVPMVSDPPGNTGNTGEGDIWEIDVPLPDMMCDNCTLQLIQAMNGQETTPVVDPSGVGTYYACVDLELVAPGTLGDPGGADPGDGMGMDDGAGMDGTGDGDPSMTGTQGNPGQNTMGGAVQPTDMSGMVGSNTGMTGSNTGSGTTGSTNGTPGSTTGTNAPGDAFMNPSMGMMSGSSGGGCSLGPVQSGSHRGPAFALSSLALGLGVFWRRRARGRA